MQQAPQPAPSSGTTIQDRSAQFVATSGGDETTSAEVLLVVAYLAMWLLVLAFVAISFRRLARLSERIDSLEAAGRTQPEPGGGEQ